ncbi:Uncharacterised protein [Legionella busanensis]|uniref:Uncharacterized protein n=1 Tax=Legionella busanensis TaxID=190655 RepID=A0A378JM55_9GAMM|nr:hypothetical protein [Legionella busanensis]STX51778.1 Uncharacterised protein [Legionella busanensis]
MKLSDARVFKCYEIEEILKRLADKIENIKDNRINVNDAENQVACIKDQERINLGFFSVRDQNTTQVEKSFIAIQTPYIIPNNEP